MDTNFFVLQFQKRVDEDVFDEDCEGNENKDVGINIASLSQSQDEVISKCKFSDADLITPTNRLDCSVIEDTFDSRTHEYESGCSSSHPNHGTPNTFRTIMELIHGSFVGSQSSAIFQIPCSTLWSSHFVRTERVLSEKGSSNFHRFECLPTFEVGKTSTTLVWRIPILVL